MPANVNPARRNGTSAATAWTPLPARAPKVAAPGCPFGQEQ